MSYAMAPKKRWFVLEDGKRISEPFPNTEYECKLVIDGLQDEQRTRNLTIEQEDICLQV